MSFYKLKNIPSLTSLPWTEEPGRSLVGRGRKESDMTE